MFTIIFLVCKFSDVSVRCVLDAILTMTANFSSSGQNIIDKQLQVDQPDLALVDYHAVFEIDRLVRYGYLRTFLYSIILLILDS